MQVVMEALESLEIELVSCLRPRSPSFVLGLRSFYIDEPGRTCIQEL